MSGSRPPEHFQAMYQEKEDPWDFAASPYEQAKYLRTMAVLQGRRFASGLEVGCSIGVLSRMLAARCACFLGVDIVEDPLAAARARCADYPWARFARTRVPEDWPGGRFDLIVLSEVLYFLCAADIDRCARLAHASLQAGGVVLLVNWLGRSDDPTTGEQAAGRFIASQPWRILRQERTGTYRLDMISGT
jgi:2-polyprenyl-3-methyl-5-hydroxy-6-metoxy-1,4-benzoquinol methylase